MKFLWFALWRSAKSRLLQTTKRNLRYFSDSPCAGFPHCCVCVVTSIVVYGCVVVLFCYIVVLLCYCIVTSATLSGSRFSSSSWDLDCCTCKHSCITINTTLYHTQHNTINTIQQTTQHKTKLYKAIQSYKIYNKTINIIQNHTTPHNTTIQTQQSNLLFAQ